MFVQQAGKERRCGLVVCLGTFAKTSLKRLNERGMGELSSVFWGALMGRKPKKERLYVYKWSIHFALRQGITIALWSNYTPINVNLKNNFFLITLKKREKQASQDFHGGAVDKNPPASTEEGFSSWSRKIPHGKEQPRVWATTPEPTCCNYWSLHSLQPVLRNQRRHPTEKPTHCNEE